MTQLKPNDYLRTPEWVWKPLGPFDLDPCAAPNGPFIAEVNLSTEGLSSRWARSAFVFCNPPFSHKELWIEKMKEHGNGILLLPSRDSAPWFGPLAQYCGGYFAMGKKINFIGGTSSNNMGTALFPFGDLAWSRLEDSGLPGLLLSVRRFTPRNAK